MTAEVNGASGLGATFEATLDVTLGKLAAAVDRLTMREEQFTQLWQDLHVVSVLLGAVPLTAGAGTLDVPGLTGPKDGYWWDMRHLSAWGFTAGSAAAFVNDANGEQVAAFPQAGQYTWSGQQFLAPRDRLVITATGITGSVFVALQAIEVSTQRMPDYLL